jgi:hypothetical protein
MVERSRKFSVNILVECTAKRDVKQLNTATDSEHRFAISDSATRQAQFDLIAQVFDCAKKRMRRLPVMCRRNVAAAAEQQTVALLIVRVEHFLITGQMDQDRNAAARFHCREIRETDTADRRSVSALE